eukprot:GHVU01154411.1.p2 GENE.GHVU01154411.1~~GHVU01154411.1.p2  ORF type:complete len:132 (+),score=33.79 GHVU01154411.1:58-396(+)
MSAAGTMPSALDRNMNEQKQQQNKAGEEEEDEDWGEEEEDEDGEDEEKEERACASPVTPPGSSCDNDREDGKGHTHDRRVVCVNGKLRPPADAELPPVVPPPPASPLSSPPK